MPKFIELSESSSALEQTHSMVAGLRPLQVQSFRKKDGNSGAISTNPGSLCMREKSFIDGVNDSIV
jgi:hypothetical protein